MAKQLKAKGTYDKQSDPVGFSNWSLNAEQEVLDAFADLSDRMEVKIDSIRDLVLKHIQEGMEIAVGEYGCQACFAEQITDAGLLYVVFPFGATDSESTAWKISLSDVVDDFIGAGETSELFEDDDDIEMAKALRDKFNELAARIDRCIPKK